MRSRMLKALGLAVIVVAAAAGVQSAGAADRVAGQVQADPLPNRPDFRLPFPCNARIELKTYVGHNPDDKKIDMYRYGMYTGSPILASADGYVHQHFYPGGIEIRHANGWFTTYMHMSARVAVGTTVRRGDWVGTMGTVGSSYPHLHYEQLYAPGLNDAGNHHIVNPLLQGVGPIYMNPNAPFDMVSTNACTGTTPTKYWVDTFADAPGHSTPGGTRTGTLNAGTNYVYCKVWGPEVRVGTAYNHWWMKTDLDTGNPWQNQYVSAYYLSRWGNDEAKDNSGTVLPDCT
jgi:hypothetical protein